MAVVPSGTEIRTFTTRTTGGGLANQLISGVEIVIPNTTTGIKYGAIWDTGATASVITENVVNQLGLKPTGMSKVHTANGETLQRTYIIDIGLPNRIIVRDVTVTAATGLSSECEVLIGMDIILLGDFSITNLNGNTCMSFRVPSCHEIDYTLNPMQGIKPGKHIPKGQAGSNFSKPKKKRR